MPIAPHLKTGSMSKPKIIILSGYGLNCEDETAHAFALAGGKTDIVHINDLAADKKKLARYQILAIPGGFSYGDDTGSGKAYANKLKNHLSEQLRAFADKNTLTIGICNGFQILTHTGLLPGALTFNDSPRYLTRWVDLQIRTAAAEAVSPWLTGITKLSLPIAHGEGKYYADRQKLAALNKNNAIAYRYARGEIARLHGLPVNPNGSLLDIAGITGYNGRVFGTMPHPERAVYFTQLPHWTFLKEKLRRDGQPIPLHGDGLQIFKNAINYFT